MKITYIYNSRDLQTYIKNNIHYTISKSVLNYIPALAIKMRLVLSEELIRTSKEFGIFSYTDSIGYSYIIGQKKNILDFIKSKKTPIFKDLVLALNNFDKVHKYNITYNQKILYLFDAKPAIMGIINLTEDSFYEPSRTNRENIINKVAALIDQGVDIIDIGPQSTRPGATEITSQEEMSKLSNIVKSIKKEFKNVWISVDTYYSDTAKLCLDEGADIINDISGGVFDGNMLKTIAKYNCPYIIGHSPYKPRDWPNMDFHYEDVVLDIINHFQAQIAKLYELGYNLHNGIIIDPCIGFSKSPIHNLEILNQIEALRILDKPILIGTSRKSFIGIVIKEFLHKTHTPVPHDRLIGSLGSIAQSIIKNACNIVRTHDVYQTKEFIALLDAIRNYQYA